MTAVSLADLIIRRVPLAPREAAALTLAVAREWDRQRSLHGTVALPDIAGIRLHPTGAISFLVTAPSHGEDDAAALSELLKRLLGVDQPAARRSHIPGALMITMAGRVGHIDLPSSTPVGFRAALLRFADDDPGALRAVFWRAAGTARLELEQRLLTRPPRLTRDRRDGSDQVTELRRSIRSLEQQVFELRQRWSLAWCLRMWAAAPPPRATAVGSVPTRRARWAAAICAIAVAASGLGAVHFWPRAVPADTHHALVSELVAQPAPAPPSSHLVEAAPVSPPPAARVGPVRVRALRPRTSRRALPAPHARPQPVFAGGARGIAWMTSR